MMSFHLCLFCSAVPYSKKPICRDCFPRLEALYLPMKHVCSTDWGFPLLSLFDWRDEKLALPRLVMAMKQGARAQLWELFAETLADQLGSFQVYLRDPLFVPIPSRLGRTPDHASLWAQALSRQLGGECRSLLKREDQTQQKQKSREERSQIRFEVTGDLGNSFRTVIIVDDLVASGATMRAAIGAFTEAKEVLGLSLVRRSLL